MLYPEPLLWLIVLWMFAIGAAAGSFLNVVVYRLPLGLSLIYPPSHCPQCGKRIPWFDNVPIFGWIMLRGRCRQCHNPISARYPIIEAVTATMFGVLAIVEMDLLTTIYPIHILLLCTLLCAALIEFDGNQPTFSLFLPALLAGFAITCFFPWLQPSDIHSENVPIVWWALMVSLLIFSATMSFACWLAIGRLLAKRKQPRECLFWSIVSLSSILGWQVGPIIAIATVLYVILWGIGHLIPRLRLPSSMAVAFVTFVWILVSATFGLR